MSDSYRKWRKFFGISVVLILLMLCISIGVSFGLDAALPNAVVPLWVFIGFILATSIIGMIIRSKWLIRIGLFFATIYLLTLIIVTALVFSGKFDDFLSACLNAGKGAMTPSSSSAAGAATAASPSSSGAAPGRLLMLCETARTSIQTWMIVAFVTSVLLTIPYWITGCCFERQIRKLD